MLTVKTNPRVNKLVLDLYAKSENKKGLWRNLAKRFEKPRPSWASPNIAHLNRVTKKGETVIVPGKVLSYGELDHAIDVYAFSASKQAKIAITKAGGKLHRVEEFLSKEPKGARILQ